MLVTQRDPFEIFITKKDKAITNPINYRPLCSHEVPAKIFEKII